MSHINQDTLKDALGAKYDSGADYIVARHRDQHLMRSKGYTLAGEIQDATENDDGTMLVFDRRKPTTAVYDNWESTK